MSLLKLVAKLTLDSSEYEASLGKAEKSAGGFGSSFGGAMTKLSKLTIKALSAATAAVGAFTVASIKTGMDFDKSMSQVYATMGDKAQEMVEYNGKTVSSMEALRDFAQEMGATTQFSAKQSADALNYMALAGYDAQESMEMLPNVMNLAAAGAMDLARASDMVTDTQTAFGMDAERTAQMVDEMAKAASTGNTSVEQLGDAFLTVGGLAKELNGGFVTLADGTQAPVDGIQEMEIALTAMANSGIKGSEAGTHMRNMLMKLSSPASEGTKQLQKLGVAVFDSEGQMRSLKDIMGDLSVKLNGLTQEQKIQAIADLFNTRDLASAEALLGAVGEDWDEIGEAILNADGAAEEMAKTQMDNLAGDITYFKSAVEGAQIAISDNLSPALREFVQEGTAGVSEFTKILRSGDITGAINSIGQTIGNLAVIVISKIPDMVKAGVVLLGGLVQGIKTAVSQIDFGSIFKEAKELFDSEANGMLSETIPNAIVNGYKFAVSFVNGMLSSAPQILSTVGSILQTIVQGFTQGLPTIISSGSEIALSLLDGIIENLPNITHTAFEIVWGIINTFYENLPSIVEAGAGMVGNLLTGIVERLPEIAETVVTIINDFMAQFEENLPAIVQTGVSVITNLVNGILQNLPQFVMMAAVAIGRFCATMTANIPQVLQRGMSIVNTLNQGIVSLAGNILASAVMLISRFIAGIAGKLGEVLNKGREIVEKIASGVLGNIGRFLSTIPTLFSRFVSSFRSKNWASIGSNIISGIINGIKNGAGRLIEAAKEAAKKAFDSVKNFFGIKSPSRLFRDEIGKMMAEGMAVGFDEGVDGEDYVEPINGLMDTIENIPTTTIETDTGETGNMSEAGMIYSLLQQYLPMFSQMSVVLYPDTVAGELAPFIDNSLGAIAIRKGRA